jgi:hypothetical protein
MFLAQQSYIVTHHHPCDFFVVKFSHETSIMIFMSIRHGSCVSSNAHFDFVFWNLVKLDIVILEIIKEKGKKRKSISQVGMTL